MGTLVSISGALIVTLYKGPAIGAPQIQLSKTSLPRQPSPSTMLATTNNWIIGALFLATASICLAVWNTAQVILSTIRTDV